MPVSTSDMPAVEELLLLVAVGVRTLKWIFP